MLSHVGCGIETGVEHLPAQIPAAVPGNGQKPAIVLLSQGACRPVIIRKARRPLPACQRQARRQEGFIQSRLQDQRSIRKQPHTVGQGSFHRHDDLIISTGSIPCGSFIVQADQNGGIRPVQLKSTVPVKLFQEIQGVLLCRLLPVQPVGESAHSQHVTDHGEAAHTHGDPALPQTAPAGDGRIRPGTVHRQDHRGRNMGIPIPANAAGHGRDGLHVEAGHSAAPGHLCVKGILPIPEGIPGKKGLQRLAVCSGALCRGNQIPAGSRRAAPGQQQTQQQEGPPSPFHGATGSPGSCMRAAHSRHRSISSQIRKQASQTSRRQTGH